MRKNYLRFQRQANVTYNYLKYMYGMCILEEITYTLFPDDGSFNN